MTYIDVLLPIALKTLLTYQVKPGEALALPCRVKVPLKSKEIIGLAYKKAAPPPHKTKFILSAIDHEPLVKESYIQWLEWAANYYQSSLNEIITTAFPSILFEGLGLEKLALKKSRLATKETNWSEKKEITLSEEQNEIIKSIRQSIKTDNPPKPFLLHGITGSGKTEIYLALIKQVLESGKSALVLVPEIGLTPQMIGRFEALFGDKLSVYHSALTENQRLAEWLSVRQPEPKLVIGTRSALFLPFSNLGLMIIDEEHDGSYKQEERVRYHARDLSIVRAQKENFPILLGSATPSLESYKNAVEGKYHLLKLHKRALNVKLPSISVIDMSAFKRQTHSPLTLSQPLLTAIEENLKAGHTTLILVNRRGFARSFLCLACSKHMQCKHCAVNLVYHKKNDTLLCHYCDTKIKMPKLCPSCQSHEVTLLGFGTETVEEELKTLFKRARIRRLDKDSTKKKGSLVATLKDLKDKKIDILVGTQMLAKGHDVHHVSLVGVVGIDSGLGVPDFRASERTFQLIVQVSGRAGRGDIPGRVIVQSFDPGHYSIQTACQQSYENFYAIESHLRHELSYPPFGRMALIRLSSNKEEKLQKISQKLGQLISQSSFKKEFPKAQILGPTPAPLEKIKNQHRYHLLIKSPTHNEIRKVLFTITGYIDKLGLSGLKWSVDVDPSSML